MPRLGISRIVLAGASGSSLAFGPGHLFGTSLPGQQGNSVIVGHRDTHFKFLRLLRTGDLITVQNGNKRLPNYLVTETQIVTKYELQHLAQTRDATLTLITCYPFDAISTGGPLRYVVIAKQNNTNNFIKI